MDAWQDQIGALALSLLSLSATSAAAEERTLLEIRPAFSVHELTAFTRPRARLPLVAEIGGRVVEVVLDIGEPIGEDGLFARIDDTFLRLELNDNLIEQNRLRDQIEFDQREVSRNQELSRKDNVAAAQLDRVRQTLRNTTQTLHQADLKAQVLKEKIARTSVKAPAAWSLIDRRIEPGQWVAAGERIGEVADFSTLILPFALTPQQLSALRETPAPLTVRLPELDRIVPVTIYRVNPALDEQTRKIRVDLRLDTTIEPQRGGLRALLRLRLPDPGHLLIPAAAVQRSFEEHRVQPLQGEPVPIAILGREQIDGQQWLRARAPDLAPGTVLQPMDQEPRPRP